MKKLDENKLIMIKKIINEIPIANLSEEEIKRLIKNSKHLNEMLNEIFLDYSEDRVIGIEVINNINDENLMKLINIYLAVENYTILDYTLLSKIEEDCELEDETELAEFNENYTGSDSTKIYLKKV